MPARRLYRSRADRKVAGVCGGLAEYFDIDPAFVRVAAVVLFFANGIGLIAYLIAWAAIPWRPVDQPAEPGQGPQSHEAGAAHDPSSSPSPPPADALHEAGAFAPPRNLDLIAGGCFIAAGALFLLLNLGILNWEIFHFWRWRVVWPLVLIALGIYVVTTSLRAQQRTRVP